MHLPSAHKLANLHMHAGLSSVLAKLEVLTAQVQQQGQVVQEEVLPRLQSEYRVTHSSVFGQQPAGVTATIHGAFALPYAELEISESSRASSSSNSKTVSVKNKGVHELALA
jgi:hypothetical protein